jgi:hypothetical protein
MLKQIFLSVMLIVTSITFLLVNWQGVSVITINLTALQEVISIITSFFNNVNAVFNTLIALETETNAITIIAIITSTFNIEFDKNNHCQVLFKFAKDTGNNIN